MSEGNRCLKRQERGLVARGFDFPSFALVWGGGGRQGAILRIRKLYPFDSVSI